MMDDCILPEPLMPGDRVAIVSPASIIDPELVTGAADALTGQGWDVWVAPHALGHNGTFSGSIDERMADMRAALADERTRAILCSRGGYGAVHLLDGLDRYVSRHDPKWLIGFSDISALHGLWHRHGIASVHASMARHLALFPVDDAPNAALLSLLSTGALPGMSWPTDGHNRLGAASGLIVGGNMAVLSGLVESPFSLLKPDTLLFVEDIAEPVYKVERMFYQLRLSGVLGRLRGLIVGRFTEYRPDVNHPGGMYDMIARMVAPYDYPVAFNAPIGHVPENMPVVEGVTATLDVSGDKVELIYS